MNECYISVDIETTGPTPGKYSMYELGVCVVGNETEQFSADIILLSPRSYSRETLKAMGTTPSMLLNRISAEPYAKVMRKFAKWVLRTAGIKTPVFVGNNAPFDWMFIAWYFMESRVKNPFGHSALDMKAYFMGMTHSSWKEANLKQMADAASVPFVKLPHKALEDALLQSKIFSALLERECK